MKVTRLTESPVISPALDPSIGENINGPSIIRVPEWLPGALGRYYLYFAHHQGHHIRMAYADEITGPYTVYTPGVLDIERTPFHGHIASPDVHVDHEKRCLWMHYHGCGCSEENTLPYFQVTSYAESGDGFHFNSGRTYLAESYLRTFQMNGWYYGMSGGPFRYVSRTRKREEPFTVGPTLMVEGEEFTQFESEVSPNGPGIKRIRHVALFHKKDHLHVFYTNVGDCPERIKHTLVDVSGDWMKWQGTQFQEVLKPETEDEGAEVPAVPSVAGAKHEPVNELRDPYLFEDDGKTYLFYSVAGERGLKVAEIVLS